MGTTCAHAGETGALAGATLAGALVEAEQRCSASGERLTAPRRRVLEQLLAAPGPVKAYDLMADYAAEGAPAKPPTVYRALEFLERLGFAHRIESLNAFVACRRPDDRSHGAAFLICDCCGAAREVEPPTAVDLERLSASSGYQVRSLVMEARGLCAACRA